MIKEAYTLFIRIPIYQTSQGRYFTDDLWAKDLALHLDYIEDFNLCCPVVKTEVVNAMTEISCLEIKSIFPLNLDQGYVSVLFNLIPNFYQTFKASRHSVIVHSDAAGWAFPLSFYLLVIRFFYSFKWMIVIESSFWMIPSGEKASVGKKLNHLLHSTLLKRVVKKADARVFTQTFYRQYFLGDDTKNTIITPAVWVNSKDLIDIKLLDSKPINQRLKVIFPARLVEDKGAALVLEALKLAQDTSLNLDITVIGEGPLYHSFHKLAGELKNNINLEVMPPVPYGHAFFSMLQAYDALLVANIKEEQPRIIFDAFSQGIGVLAADTSGILDIVKPGENALTFKRADAKSMVEVLIYAAQNPLLVRKLGENGLKSMSKKNHNQMHMDRLVFINNTLLK